MFLFRSVAPALFALLVLAPVAVGVLGLAGLAVVPAVFVVVALAAKVFEHRRYAALRRAYAAL